MMPQKKICLVSRNPTNPPVLPLTQNFFRHNLHSVKIGNLHSISQAPFRFHSIVLVQRQHGKTGAQVNNFVVFFPMNVSGDRYSRKCSDIIAGFITFTKYIKGQFCNTAPSVFKVPNDEFLAVYVHKVTSIMNW